MPDKILSLLFDPTTKNLKNRNDNSCLRSKKENDIAL